MKLSDAFTHGNGQSKMELQVQILNVNDGHNKQLMEACPTLHQYAILVSRIKAYSKKMDFEDAVNKAINECIEEDVLREFLLRRRAEVMNSILTEYDEEQVLAEVGQEKYEEGRSDGRAEGINALILDNIEDGKSEEEILGKLIKRFLLEDADAKKHYDVCVKNMRK